jgi:hypothetical protein
MKVEKMRDLCVCLWRYLIQAESQAGQVEQQENEDERHHDASQRNV